MATTKKRLNITLSPESEVMITKLAARDKVPAATKVRELLEEALLLVEDETLTMIAEDRLKQSAQRKLSHAAVWGE